MTPWLPGRFLTSTEAPEGAGPWGPQVAVQALDVVAGPVVVALLVELRGAHLAAAARVRHPADQWGTGWGRRGAGAHGRAAPLGLLVHGAKGRLRTGGVMSAVSWSHSR